MAGNDSEGWVVSRNHDGRLWRIEGFVLAAAAMLAFLAIFGSARRCYYSSVLRWIIQGSYVLSAILIPYTLGLMQSAPFRNEFFAVWVVFLVSVSGGVDSISAYSLEDNQQWRRFAFKIHIHFFWACFLMGIYMNEKRIPVFILFSTSIIRYAERYYALMMGSGYYLDRIGHAIAKLMRNEHELSNPENINPVTMSGYKYSSKIQLEDEKDLVSVDEVWQCQGKLLASTEDQDSKRKDICLSYALFSILCCRFGGYGLPEYSSHEKTSRFVREGLLSDEDRAFRVIEGELAFLYDLFYTKYAFIFSDGPAYRLVQLWAVTICCYIIGDSLKNYTAPFDSATNKIKGHNVEVVVTGILLAGFIILEITQILFLFSTQWGKLYLLRKYIKKQSLQQSKSFEFIFHIIFHLTIPWMKPWGRKLGQYSFLKSYNNRPIKIIFNDYTSKFFEKPGIGRESSLVKLPTEVKRAVVAWIKTVEHPQTNGMISLQKHGVEDEISWACQLKTEAQVVMVWHIATTICEDALTKSEATNEEEYVKVATSLSKYCAYLVAFSPRLPPGQAYDTEVSLDDMVKEATKFFKGCKTIESRRAKLMLSDQGQQLPEGSVLKQSRDLASILINIGNGDEARLWRILSDFWTEMILFLAPSGDPIAHAEHLATGGEFVTHLWALLFHAGIHGRNSTLGENV